MHVLPGELRCGSRRIGVTWPLSRLLSNLGHFLIFFQMLSSLDVCVATFRLAVISKMILCLFKLTTLQRQVPHVFGEASLLPPVGRSLYSALQRICEFLPRHI